MPEHYALRAQVTCACGVITLRSPYYCIIKWQHECVVLRRRQNGRVRRGVQFVGNLVIPFP